MVPPASDGSENRDNSHYKGRSNQDSHRAGVPNAQTAGANVTYRPIGLWKVSHRMARPHTYVSGHEGVRAFENRPGLVNNDLLFFLPPGTCGVLQAPLPEGRVPELGYHPAVSIQGARARSWTEGQQGGQQL